MLLSVVEANVDLAISRTEMCGGVLMVEIDVVVVDILYKKSRKAYAGVISHPHYIMISEIPLPSKCIYQKPISAIIL